MQIVAQAWQWLSRILGRSKPAPPSLKDMLLEAQRICQEEQYELPASVRHDRENVVLTEKF